MKKIVYFLLLALIVLGYGVYDFVKNAPSDLYQKGISGKISSTWFSSKDFRRFLAPSYRKVEQRDVQTKNWWKLVQLDSFKFPLPYRNPLFRVAPILPNQNKPQRGLIYLDNDEQEILRITYNPVSYFAPARPKEKFYEIPLVDHLTSGYETEKLWQDLFTRKVPEVYLNYKQAILDLFLLEQRVSFLGEKPVDFGMVSNNSGFFFVELEHKDKDYIWERFFIKDKERVYSFDLETFRQSDSAQVFRSFVLYNTIILKDKLINDEIAYSRFEQLDRESQESELGFIHLFSAWSQIKDGRKYIKEMVYYAEKSAHLKHVLSRLYIHSLYKYKTMFAHHESIFIELDGNLELKRQIEIEKIRERNTKVKYRGESRRSSRTLKSEIRRKIDLSKKNKKKKIYRIN